MNKEYLHKVLDQLVSETDIDYGRGTVFAPSLLSPFPLHYNSPPLSSLSFFPYSLFSDHCRDMYGLTKKETIYVWKQYKSIIEDKIKNKPLNESTEDNALNKIVDQLVSETIIDYVQEKAYPPFSLSTSPFSSRHSSYSFFPLSSPSSSFLEHCEEVYGLTEEEVKYVWKQYKQIIKDKIKKG